MDILVIKVLLSRVFMPIGAIKKLFETKTPVLVFEVLFTPVWA